MGNSRIHNVYVWCGHCYLYCRNAALSGIPVDQEKMEQKKTKNLEEVTNSGRYNYSADRNCFAWFCTEGFYQTF